MYHHQSGVLQNVGVYGRTRADVRGIYFGNGDNCPRMCGAFQYQQIYRTYSRYYTERFIWIIK